MITVMPVLYIAIDKTGRAKTREAKLDCVLTQTIADPEGYALRNEGSTAYVGAIETADRFGMRAYADRCVAAWLERRSSLL